MYRVLISTLSIFVISALSSVSFALDSEYKNNLTKIELNKASDTSYSVNLYTSKQFTEPVKVIKKSDLNYYILLPETKNSTQNLSAGNSDIRGVSAQVFPYAGSDVKNGYTKINITTTKPINFTINTKATTAANPQTVIIANTKKEEVKTAVSDTKVQKKNLVQEQKNIKDSSSKDSTLKSAQKANILPQKEVKTTVPKAAAKVADKKQEPQVKQEKKEAKKQETKKQEVKQTKEEKKPEVKKQETKKIQKEPQKQEVKPQKKEVKKEEPKEEVKEPAAPVTEEKAPEIEKEVKEETLKEPKEEIKEEKKPQEFFEEDLSDDIEVYRDSILVTFKNKVQKKLLEYGLSIKEFLLMIIAGFLSFIIMLMILTRKQDVQTRIKSKADFMDRTSKPTLVGKKSAQKQKPNNQYFVFDKNVKQTGLMAPMTGDKKNFELSSYNPTIENNNSVKVEPYQVKKVTSEYDIIQKILKEDTFIELTDRDVINKKEEQPAVKKSEIQKIEKAPVALEENVKKDEPEILSSVEIAPQRGFMCVSYNNSINLVGYIFDDVFALYNFQQPKLENYTISFRLSEKTPQGANFFVRVGRSKMLVSVTKSSMNLEVAM
ncbi:MAG: hypothetical protein IJ877_03690 [Candidatus Gastranaerophilales bacterium]|nr:hypothetical protein [Candidatus Gastranaerophilales bacterium]